MRGIVLNAALVPVEGGCGIDCMQGRHRDGLRLAVESAARDGRTITLPPPADPEASRRAYGGDPLDDATLAFVLDPARSVEDTVHHYFQPVQWSAAAGVPVTYVVNERDRPIRPEMQEVMMQRLPPPVEVIRLVAPPEPSKIRPSIAIRSPSTPGAAMSLVKFFSKMSNPAWCGMSPICT